MANTNKADSLGKVITSISQKSLHLLITYSIYGSNVSIWLQTVGKQALDSTIENNCLEMETAVIFLQYVCKTQVVFFLV